MHKPSKTRWGGWSDWIWNEDYQRYYRQRQDTNGNTDYEWHEEAAAATDEQTPRESNLEALTQDLQNTHIHQSPPSSSGYDSYSPEYITSGSTRPKSKSSSSKSKSKSKSSSSRSKGKSKAYDEEDDDTERDVPHGGSYRQAIPEEQPQPQPVYDHETGQYYYPDALQQPQAAPQYAHTAYDETEDPNVTAAIAASRGYNDSAHSVGEASSSAYGTIDYEDEGPPTPRAGSSRTHIAATEGEAEQLDPRYRVEPSWKFQPGEIFKVLWCEPEGSGNEGAPSVSDRQEFRNRFGCKMFVGFRRFIVVANDQGHCTCVPILTYGGKACNKRGVKPEKHGIVYERGHRAKLLSGEPKLGFPPVKVEITLDGEKLSKESRVNYSKLITVEHNVKVLFIGRVVPSETDLVADAVNRCWEEKIHHKKRHFGG